ncbi:MAG TPA: zinc ribbon domain-containing protein [Clostridia bacterium]|nr:zinc ribbon domain-containing protein [Clostridia bacterium]
MKTIVLKLHGPGKEKRRILDEAISNYNTAYRFLVDRARSEISDIREKYGLPDSTYKAGMLLKWVDGGLGEELNRFNIQPFKDSLKFELGMTMAGYLNLEDTGSKTRFPRLGRFKERPLYFCRYDTKRSYCLLYDKDKDRFYAKLYLMNRKSARPLDNGRSKKSSLEYVCAERGMFESKSNRATYIIVPLSFGKYQEGYLREALADPCILRTARLMKQGGDFYLAVSISSGEIRQVTAETFMGVSRGLKNSLNYSIVDMTGGVIDSGSIRSAGGNDGKGYVHLNELHSAANFIVSIAQKNRSQVVLENLTETGDGISWNNESGEECRPIYNCRTYIRLTELLGYKLTDNGLPPPIKVSSTDLFYRCHECGFYSKQNRFAGDIFICTKCGATMKADDLGSLNLAGKLISYGSSKIKIKVVKTTEGTIFVNKLIGLDHFIPYSENQADVLKQEIQRHIEDLRECSKHSPVKRCAGKTSLLRKFDSSPDCMDSIEFV